MRPDLLIVGDSHSAALQEAAIARGLRSEMLYISGNLWHENKMRPHPTQGLSTPHRRGLNRRIAEFSAKVQGSAFPKDIPVLASIGYHLGRLVPPFQRHGHSPDPAHAGVTEDALFVSDAFLLSYIFHHRNSLFRLLRLAGQDANLLVIAPPMIHSGWFSASQVPDATRSGSNHRTNCMSCAWARSDTSRIPLGKRCRSTSQVPVVWYQAPSPGYQPASMK